MYCHKCGSKSLEGAIFCQKCGAKLIKVEAETQALVEPIIEPVSVPAETPSLLAEPISTAVQESVMSKPSAPSSEGTAEVCDLLSEGLSHCSKIKSVSPTSKGNAIIMKGKVYNYIANVVNGQIRLNRAITIPFTIPFAIIVGFLAWVIASIGWDMIDYGFNESYALPLAIGLIALGSFFAILSFLGERETATVLPYIRQTIEPRELLVPPDEKQKRSYIITLSAMLVIAVIGIVMLIFIVIDNFEFGSSMDVPAAEFVNSTSSIVDNVSLSQTYTNEDEGFLFMYPGNWDVKEESTMVAVFAPAESGYSASIAIIKGDADERYFSATMSDFESLYSYGKDSFRMLDLSDITLSGHSARKLIYTYNDNRGSYTQVQYFYIVNSDMYFVTCSSLKEHFDKYAPVFDTIMDSYTITATNSSEESGIAYSDTMISMEDALNIAKQFIDEHPLYLRTITGAVDYEPTDTRYNYDITGLYRIGLIADDGSDRTMWVSKETGEVFISPDGVFLLTGEEYYKTNIVGEEAYTPSASKINARDLIGNFSYDASFTDPSGRWNNFYYLLEIGIDGSDLVVTTSWRGMYMFDHVRVSPDSLTGNTLVFDAITNDSTEPQSHSLTYIPAKDSALGKDTIYIDGDETMPYVRE